MEQLLRQVGLRMVDAVFPPQCPSCGGLVETHGHLCPACWGRIRFIDEPCCSCCSIPLDYETEAGALCLVCLRQPPSFDCARAVMLYDDFSRGLVLKFKHADRLDPAGAYARWMVRAGSSLLARADMVAPVPLHWTRLFARRYNQSAVLARHVARHAGAAFCPDLLRRTRPTPSQGRLTRNQRGRNVRGAFAVDSHWADGLAGRRVLLVDDVMTTGATAEHCARALLRGGAGAVDVLTLARVALPGQQAI